MIRLLFALFIFLSSVAIAETQPAMAPGTNYTAQYKTVAYFGRIGSDRNAVCASFSNTAITASIVSLGGLSACRTVRTSDGYTETANPSYTSGCKAGDAVVSNADGLFTCKSSVYQCPATGGWTLSGTTCTRPDCPSGKVRNTLTDQCIVPCEGHQTSTADGNGCQCDANSFNNTAKGTEWLEGTGSMPSQACSGGCQFNTGFGLKGKFGWAAERGAMTGQTCATGAKQEKPPIPTKQAPCGATEGVMTSTSGNVMCVPAGTPHADKPAIEKKTQKETFPDGNTKTTETTVTTDPTSGATSTSVTSTSTGGQAGSEGTSTSTSNTSNNGVPTGNGNSDSPVSGDEDSDCDPTLDFCGGPATSDLYKKGEDKLDTVLKDFRTKMEASDIYKAGDGFFKVNIPSGSCPPTSYPVPYLNTTLDLSVLCDPFILHAMDMAGWVVLFIATFIAFRWAFL